MNKGQELKKIMKMNEKSREDRWSDMKEREDGERI